AAAYDAYDIFSRYFIAVKIKGSYSQGAGRFGHDGVFVIQFKNGGAYPSFRDEMHVIQQLVAILISQITDAFYSGTINEAIDFSKCNGAAVLQGRFHGRRSRGFHAIDVDSGIFRFEIGARSSGEAAS